MKISKQIGDFLKNERVKAGLTQEQLIKLMGFKSKNSIVKIEKGIARVTVEQLLKYYKILNFDLSKFFETIDYTQLK